MCGGGGFPANVDLIVPFLAIGENDNPNCQQLHAFGLQSISENASICSLIQDHKDFCGCPGASTMPQNACTLCPDGGTPLYLNAKTPFDDTCSELDTYLRYLPADVCLTERIGSIKRAAAFCGCPGVEAECTMCPDKKNVLSNGDRKVPFYEFLGTSFSSTCQDLADFYTLYDTDDPELDTCEFVQMESHYCGCENIEDTSPINACKLCTDGQPGTDPDRYIDELELTCGELEIYLSHVPADQCEMPWVVDFSRFDYLCGCNGATAPCPICPDGSINITNDDAIVPYLIIPKNDNPTCRQLATLGVIAEPGELVLDNCTIFEAQAAFCGCPGTSKPETSSCPFCPDGSDPPKAELETPFGDTCKELSDYLSYLPEDQCGTDRVGFIKRQDFLCGCASATTNCALCPDHGSNDASYGERHIPLLSLPTNSNPTCSEIVEFLAVNDGDLSDTGCSALQEYQGYCGCPEMTPREECSFCPHGGTPANATKVVSELYTCEELNAFVSFLPGDECGANSTDFEQIQAYAYVCGCPHTEPSCTLCPDGSAPPQADKNSGDDMTTCGEFADFVASLTTTQCAAQTSEIASVAATCGCSGTMEPAPSPTTTTTTTTSSSSGKCAVQQNAKMCTRELLDSVPEDQKQCDCYAFCDKTFVKCQSSDGGLLEPAECLGTPITGCNRAGVYVPSVPTGPVDVEDDDSIDASAAAAAANKAKQKYNSGGGGGVNTTIVIATVVPVLLAVLVAVYYFFTRTPNQGDAKATDDDDDENAETDPLPVRAMEGSLSTSDLPISSPRSPPPESFSIDDGESPAETTEEGGAVVNDDDDEDDGNKLV